MPPATASAPPPASAALVPPAAPAFSAGTVIGKSFSAWFANFAPFSIVTLAVYAPVAVVAALAPAEGTAGSRGLDRFLSGLAGFVVTGALTYGVLESLRGGRASVGALFGTGFRNIRSVFLVSLLVGLVLVGGLLLLVVPGIVWYCATFVAIPAVVVEPGLGAVAALRRSRALTKGSRWPLFVVALVVGIVSLVAFGLAGVLAVLLPESAAVVFATALVALASSLGACASAVAYHDLRVAKEGIATADLVKVFE